LKEKRGAIETPILIYLIHQNDAAEVANFLLCICVFKKLVHTLAKSFK
jgi:hypothetical protein